MVSTGHVSVVSVASVWGNKEAHGTHGNGGAEVNVSVVSVFSVWDKKKAHRNHRTHGKGGIKKKYLCVLWFLCGVIKRHTELTERVVPK